MHQRSAGTFSEAVRQQHCIVVLYYAIQCRQTALRLQSFWGVFNFVLTPAVDNTHSALPAPHMCEPRLTSKNDTHGIQLHIN